jgi:hypothetical protein
MKNIKLLFGPLSALVFFAGVAGLGLLVPGNSQIHQTVSEIGEQGSPAQLPFSVMLWCLAACTLVFAWGIWEACGRAEHSRWSAYLVAYMSVAAAALGVFAFPHPLHNWFGLSELIAYQAPGVLAFTWRGDPRARKLVIWSWVFFAALWLAVGLNLGPMARGSTLWAYERPIYGLVQRSLFLSWSLWCATAGVLLWRLETRPAARGVVASSSDQTPQSRPCAES